LDPVLFDEWRARRQAVAVATEDAKRGKLDPLLECLIREVSNPLPAELPHWPSDYTASELIQLSILNPLSKTPQREALVEAYTRMRANLPIEKRMVIALGLAGLVGLEEEDQTVLKRCLTLLRDDKHDFIRACAARALRQIGLANRDMIPQIEPALRAALTDTAGRPNMTCSTAYGKTVYLVRAQARGALLGLGIQLAPGEGVPYSD